MRNRWSVFIIATQLFVGAASADDLSAEAVAQREGIVPAIREGLVRAGDYCFSAAVAQAANDSESAMNAAEKHASAKALSQYLAATLLIDDPPAGLPKSLLEDVRSRCATVIVARLTLGGVETVQESRDTKQRIATVVKAVTAKQLDQERRHWTGCVELIRASAREKNLEDALLWAEILRAENQSPAEAVDLWIAGISERPGISATVRCTPIAMTDGWTRLPQGIPPEKLAKLPTDRLLELLDRRPFDGVLIDTVQDRLNQSNRFAAAEATTQWHRVRQSAENGDAILRGTCAAVGIDCEPMPMGVLTVLRHRDTWPIFDSENASKEAVDFFKAGNLAAAVQALIAQVGERPNADSVNYLAACMLAAKQPDIAEAWSRIAFAWAPAHPYAGVNLARSLEQQKRIPEARRVAAELHGKPFLDDWGRGEVTRIQSRELKGPGSPQDKP
jgi:hypothetical protein